MFKSLVVTAALLQAAAGPYGCGQVNHQVGNPVELGTWKVVEAPIDIPLTEVSAVSPTEVYLLGAERQFFRFDGTQVNEMNVGPTGTIVNGLAATGPGEFTAVGNDGNRGESNLRYSAKALTLTSEAAGRGVLSDAALLPNGEVVAVGGTSGSNGTVYRRTSSGWTDVALPSSYPYFSAVSATSDGVIYLLHIQGVLEVSGARSGDVAMPSTVFEKTALFAVKGASQDRLFLGGVGGELAASGPNGWTVTKVGAQPWNAIWGASENDVWAVGHGGAIAHFDGAAWTQVTSPTTKNLYALHGTADGHLVAVGDTGAVLTYGN